VNETFSITSDQISKLHNAYWLLSNEIAELEDVFSTSKITSLRKGLSILKDAYSPLSEEKDKEWDRRNSYYDDIKQANKFKSVWSIYEVVSFQASSGFGNGILKYDNVKVSMREDTNLGCITWMDMWKFAEQAIRESGDDHHMFIERFYDRGDGVIELITGS
jgi:hypothetical protein